jgi:hypothetical protein
MMAHWVERQLLTTSNYVALVGPLPQNEEVAGALSNYAVNQLFTKVDIETQIKEALPDRASFLAAPLADQLDARLTKRTKQFIQSDTFETIWSRANQVASQRLLSGARGEAQPQSQLKLGAKLPINLSALRGPITNFLGNRNAGQPAEKKNVGLAVSLKTTRETLHKYIRAVDYLNATLWVAAIACLLGAVVLSRSRRLLLLLVTSATAVIALLQIIGVKALQPYVLNQVQQASYRPAVRVVYESLVATFRHTATTVFIVSLILFVVIYVLHGPILQRSNTTAQWLRTVPKSAAGKYYFQTRDFFRQYRWYIMGVVGIVCLALVAFVVNITWRTGTNAILLTIILIELVNLIAARPGELPMKQKRAM